MSNIAIHENEDKKIIAKIQHFYDVLKERKNTSFAVRDSLSVDQELDILIQHFEKVFDNLIYKSD
jgi:hypothetical protein